MARNNRHNVAFVVGSMLGAVAGAAVALWKTPYSGDELRAKLTISGQQASGASTSTTTIAPASSSTGDQSLKDKVLAGVEKTLAPIVGVELGKTANDGAVAGSDMRVKREFASNASSGTGSATGGGDVSVTHAADGSEMIGLSRDKVDPEKWAAAYAGTDSGETSGSGTATSAPTPTPTSTTSFGQGTSLRHQHNWHGDVPSSTETPAPATSAGSDEVSVTHDASGASMIGLSRDRVNAARWAAAYEGQDLDAESASSSATPTTTTNTDGGASGGSGSASGTGAALAYPGQDVVGHPPANDQAPESSVADVSRGADSRTGGSADTTPVRPDMDAASTDQLTRPQVDRVPDSMRAPTDHGMHPFPTLGGKE